LSDVREVTVVMTTFNNNDFTKASLWSIRRYHPEIKIILTDGGSEPQNYAELIKLVKADKNLYITQFIGGSTEECRNIAATLVNTKYILFMDNDVKIIGERAISILIDAIERKNNVAQTGAYGIKVIDWKNIKAYVGSEFNDYMEIDASPCYFSLHKTSAYRMAGGMPKEWFYDLPKDLTKLWDQAFKELGKSGPGYTGDFTISKYYKKQGWRILSPRETVPVIHWTQANRWFTDITQNRALENWWHENINHIKCEPLNDWEKLENGNS
jgi:hypothetical protein